MSENAIEVQNLWIRYKSLKKYSVKKQLLAGRTDKGPQRDMIEAVKNVSFCVPKGEIWGIIGRNGSGKSTLLKAVGGVFSPDEGSIDLKGNSVSLLAIGIGFKPDLTGRENIMLSGLLLGFGEQEIRDRTDEIIEFSELGEFIDYPVRTYSSGMHSKLAFSITAILETDIILVDEVLSVGDEHFRKKSMRKMRSLMSDENRTVLIVSHNIPTVRELCTQVLWLHDGEVRRIGDTQEILDEYAEFMK